MVVQAGISEGEHVVTSNQYRLEPGRKVRINPATEEGDGRATAALAGPCDEHLRALYPPAHRHLAADVGHPAGRHGDFSDVAGRAAPAGGLSDHSGVGQSARREPRDHGVRGCHAARISVRGHTRRFAAHLLERARRHPDHRAVRPGAQHRRRGAGFQSAIDAAGGQLPKNLPSPPL